MAFTEGLGDRVFKVGGQSLDSMVCVGRARNRLFGIS
jgi:hypothetical protein